MTGLLKRICVLNMCLEHVSWTCVLNMCLEHVSWNGVLMIPHSVLKTRHDLLLPCFVTHQDTSFKTHVVYVKTLTSRDMVDCQDTSLCQDTYTISRHNYNFQDTTNNLSRRSFKIDLSRNILCVCQDTYLKDMVDFQDMFLCQDTCCVCQDTYTISRHEYNFQDTF